MIREFESHPEAKSADVDGNVNHRWTVGLLGRREVRESFVVHVGKEANKLEEVEAGFEHDPEVIYTEYHRPGRNEWTEVIRPQLLKSNLEVIAKNTGLSVRQLRTPAHGKAAPHAANLQKIERALLGKRR